MTTIIERVRGIIHGIPQRPLSLSKIPEKRRKIKTWVETQSVLLGVTSESLLGCLGDWVALSTLQAGFWEVGSENFM